MKCYKMGEVKYYKMGNRGGRTAYLDLISISSSPSPSNNLVQFLFVIFHKTDRPLIFKKIYNIIYIENKDNKK